MANVITAAARELRDRIQADHAAKVGAVLGCSVVILRHEPVKTKAGRFTGIVEPVFGMPAEFIEQAQILGLLAEAR